MNRSIRLWITILILGVPLKAEASLSLRGSRLVATGGTARSQSFFGVFTAGAQVLGSATSGSFQIDPSESIPVGSVVGIPDLPPDGPALELRAASNPFHRATRFRVVLPEAGTARLTVFDLSGKLVATVLSAPLSGGAHDVTWDGLDRRGAPVAVGMYFVRLMAGPSMVSIAILKVD